MIAKRSPIEAFDCILNITAFLGALLLIVQMILVNADIVLRYFLNSPIRGASEIAEVSLLYLTFLGAAWLLRCEGHISVDILAARLSERTLVGLRFLTSALGCLIFAVLSWSGAKVTYGLWAKDVVTPTILELPRAGIVIIIPLGCFLLCVQFARRAIKAWRSRKLPIKK